MEKNMKTMKKARNTEKKATEYIPTDPNLQHIFGSLIVSLWHGYTSIKKEFVSRTYGRKNLNKFR